MKIAICEDNPKDAGVLKDCIRKYDPQLVPVHFSDAEKFLAACEKEHYDIVFLDIDLGERNGYEIGVELKKKDSSPLIIFTTQLVEYAVRGYGIAERYLTKPLSYEAFQFAFDDVCHMLRSEKVMLTSKGRNYIIDLKKVMFYEVISHSVEFVCNDGTVVAVPLTMKEAVDAVYGANFCQIHRSYCVNFDYIDRIEGKTALLLTNGKKLYISRSYQEIFSQKLEEYFKYS